MIGQQCDDGTVVWFMREIKIIVVLVLPFRIRHRSCLQTCMTRKNL